LEGWGFARRDGVVGWWGHQTSLELNATGCLAGACPQGPILVKPAEPPSFPLPQNLEGQREGLAKEQAQRLLCQFLVLTRGELGEEEGCFIVFRYAEGREKPAAVALLARCRSRLSF